MPFPGASRIKVSSAILLTGVALSFLLLANINRPVVNACPVETRLGAMVWADLKFVPTDTPADLVGFYDRSSGLQLAMWASLIVSALACGVLIIERAVRFSRATSQTRLFLSLANQALVFDRASEALWLASRFPLSPVACLVTLSLTEDAAGQLQFSTCARHIAATAKTAEIARGLATLGAIGMTTPIVGAAAVAEGLVRCLRLSADVFISYEVLWNWIAGWLSGLLFALLLSVIAVWAHRLLAARANRLLLEMDRLSLGITSSILNSRERPRARRQLQPALEHFGANQ